MLRRLASRLPENWQHSLRKGYYRWQIRSGHFRSEEREYEALDTFLGEGDWAIDIGANIGHYTERLSNLVGVSGRVFAFEPIPTTFEILTSNSRCFRHQNVTLMNIAASDRVGLVRMDVPSFGDGLGNYYAASINPGGSGVEVYRCPLDSLSFPRKIALVKIDVEGHEMEVIDGMKNTIQEHIPVIIVEWNLPEVVECLESFGYELKPLPSATNYLFQCRLPGTASPTASSASDPLR